MNKWVIKIGGSLYDSEHLVKWLSNISICSQKQIVIVPGGGPFADQVRYADEKFNLKELHSHHMAVMAMQQYGTLLASLCPELELANSIEKIHRAWDKDKSVIWEPYELIRDECKLDKTWEITSDSLALWLADYLQIKNILYVKSSKIVENNASIASLVDNECIDANVKCLSEKYSLNIHFLHKSKAENLNNILSRN